ncbi:unnamed protein product [Adineta ricciae]|uniref:Uncharacterized protein n=1 Tax=Adineta ricciae TaxID=249248 RepID=A0A815ZC00_ADIRI|nr:unnamed protein product [Adineta ricciae]CAF1580812.1 unnamed protein product [Adineta ricciae]
MSSSRGDETWSRFNFRPRSNYQSDSFSRRRNNRYQGAIQDDSTNYNSSSRFTNHISNQPTQQSSDGLTPNRLKTIDDEKKAYAVNLQLEPVKMGIMARNDQRQQEFKGLGAFNQYFGLLSPADGFGYTLPDVWDGYFHITLAKFTTDISPEDVKDIFSKFDYPSANIPIIRDIFFHASRLDTFAGSNRASDRNNIPFIVLSISSTPEVQAFYNEIGPLLAAIKHKVKPSVWEVTSHDKLHVTIRKYSKINYKNYSLQDVPIHQFPLEFRCSYVGIREPRDKTINRIKQNKDSLHQWLSGVTEIDGKCSGCQTSIASKEWQGFCYACGKYEIIKPLWSSSGNKPSSSCIQQANPENSVLDKLVEAISLNNP